MKTFKNMNLLYLLKPLKWGPPVIVYVVVRGMQKNAAKKG